MRYILYTLLAVNLAYLVYGLASESPEMPARAMVRHPVGTETLFLLSENGAGRVNGQESEREKANRVINRPVMDAISEDAQGACLAIGPFADLFSGQGIVEQLRALDIGAELRAMDEATGQSDYRVMIPPASSLQDAFRKLRELKSRNIDSYVLTQGKDALGISLGVFSSQESARKAQRDRERDGYVTTIVEIPRMSREFWIFGADSKSLALESALWESLVAENEGLEQRLVTCPTASNEG